CDLGVDDAVLPGRLGRGVAVVRDDDLHGELRLTCGHAGAARGRGARRVPARARRRPHRRPDRGRGDQRAEDLRSAGVGGGRVARVGREALAGAREEFEQRLKLRRGQVKGVLTEQEIIAGIGNAYSDEILHAARMSPFAITDRLPAEALDRLYAAMRAELTDAVDRSVGR